MIRIIHLILLLPLLVVSDVIHARGHTAMPLTVMTFNIENGGTQIDFDAIAKIIQYAQADVVGIQEAWGNLERLAALLHWPYVNRQQHIVSRLPLLVAANGDPRYVYIELAKNKVVAMANTHLPDDPYGPDLVASNASVDKVIANEQRTRLRFISPLINTLATLSHRGIPVILTGDFNSPSHLDWTSATTSTVAHHRYAVTWPVTSTLNKLGFQDAYRINHPDPVASPGVTWPAFRPVATQSYDGFNPSNKDLADRIDFIFIAGPANSLSSAVIGESTMHAKKPLVAQWPSDHRAVVTQLLVTPSHASVDLIRHRHPSLPTPQQPQVSVHPQRVKAGEAFVIRWKNAPGYSYDYITMNAGPPEDSPRLYTHGHIQGQLTFNKKNSDGNWPAWHPVTTKHWPLAPGQYVIKLMSDDSETVLASTTIEVFA